MPDDGSSGQMFEDLLTAWSRLTDFLRKAKKRMLARWKKTSLRVKILLWLPFQAVMFKIQPVLWGALTMILSGTTSVASGVASLLGALQIQTQLILILTGLFAVQTTVLSLRLDRYQKTLKRVTRNVEEAINMTDDVLTTVEDIESEVEDIYLDGGKRINKTDREADDLSVKTTGTGVIGGAIAGGAFGGAIGGPAGAIGGAVLGVILGDEVEKRSIKRGQREGAHAVRPTNEKPDTGSADSKTAERSARLEDLREVGGNTGFLSSGQTKRNKQPIASEKSGDEPSQSPHSVGDEDRDEINQH